MHLQYNVSSLVCQKSNVQYPVMPGQVKARAKELDNNELHLHLLWKLFHCNFIVLLSSGPGSPFFKG